MQHKMKAIAQLAEICRLSEHYSETDDASLERFATLIIHTSTQFLKDMGANFEAAQLLEFWELSD